MREQKCYTMKFNKHEQLKDYCLMLEKQRETVEYNFNYADNQFVLNVCFEV